MEPSDYIRSFITSPLSVRTTKTRANLLISGSTGVVVAHTGLVPSKIDGLGISFNESQQYAFAVILIVIICYFLIEYSLASFTEYYAAYLKRKDHVETQLSDPDFLEGSLSEVHSKFEEVRMPLEVSESKILILSISRIALDIFTPIAVGIYSVGAMLWHACHL